MNYTQIISGLNHSQGYAELAEKILPGSVIKLEPMPSNPYDKQAIKVIFEDEHIGWIPMKNAGKPNLAKKEIFEAIEAGVEFECEVLLHEMHRPLYDRLTISVKAITE